MQSNLQDAPLLTHTANINKLSKLRIHISGKFIAAE